jgi:hypothetical protein
MGELKKIQDDTDDELVWTLFGVRISICESEGTKRTALEHREHELVEQLASVIDPNAHVDLPHRGAPAEPIDLLIF